jgi:hypothetical protein
MRIAALFVGRIKCFERTYENILDHVFAGHKVDVFLSHNAYNTGDDISAFTKIFKPVLVESSLAEPPLHILTHRNHDGGQYANHRHYWWQAYFMKRGVAMIESYARETSQEYDAVVYLRADMHFLSPVKFQMRAPDTVYIPALPDWFGICDQFAYGTLSTMQRYAATVDHLEEYLARDLVSIHPETLALHNIKAQGLAVTRFSATAVLDNDRYYDGTSFSYIMNRLLAGQGQDTGQLNIGI